MNFNSNSNITGSRRKLIGGIPPVIPSGADFVSAFLANDNSFVDIEYSEDVYALGGEELQGTEFDIIGFIPNNTTEIEITHASYI
jgi:hypothetical protein